MHRQVLLVFLFCLEVWLAVALSRPRNSHPFLFYLHIQFKDFRDRLFDSPYSSTAGDVAALLTLSTLPPPSMGCSGWSMLLLSP